MIKFLLDVLQLINNVIPLFFSIAVFVTLVIVFAKSIRKHATVYYWILSIPFILTLVPFFLSMAGMDVPPLNHIPVLNYFMGDYAHMATLGFPLLIIIMYMGALDTRNRYVARLMSIRKELSIIVGFPVLTHATLRVFNTFPTGWKFFFAHDEYMAEEHVDSILGAGISSFVFVLGIVMLTLFIVLWVTSFTAVRRRLGQARWKLIQKWAYVLYALLFIHSMGLQIGGLLNAKPQEGSKTELLVKAAVNAGQAPRNDTDRDSQGINPANNVHREKTENDSQHKRDDRDRNSLAKIEIGHNVQRYIHIASVILIFGSYLVLRLRKAAHKAGHCRHRA